MAAPVRGGAPGQIPSDVLEMHRRSDQSYAAMFAPKSPHHFGVLIRWGPDPLGPNAKRRAATSCEEGFVKNADLTPSAPSRRLASRRCRGIIGCSRQEATDGHPDFTLTCHLQSGVLYGR